MVGFAFYTIGTPPPKIAWFSQTQSAVMAQFRSSWASSSSRLIVKDFHRRSSLAHVQGLNTTRDNARPTPALPAERLPKRSRGRKSAPRGVVPGRRCRTARTRGSRAAARPKSSCSLVASLSPTSQRPTTSFPAAHVRVVQPTTELEVLEQVQLGGFGVNHHSAPQHGRAPLQGPGMRVGLRG